MLVAIDSAFERDETTEVSRMDFQLDLFVSDVRRIELRIHTRNFRGFRLAMLVFTHYRFLFCLFRSEK